MSIGAMATAAASSVIRCDPLRTTQFRGNSKERPFESLSSVQGSVALEMSGRAIKKGRSDRTPLTNFFLLLALKTSQFLADAYKVQCVQATLHHLKLDGATPISRNTAKSVRHQNIWDH